MADELTYKNEAATGYDRAFARVTTHFAPFLLDAIRTRSEKKHQSQDWAGLSEENSYRVSL